MATFTQFIAFWKSIRRYFKGYGGWAAVICSPIFIFSLIATGLNYTNWINPKWVARSFDMIPSLLGFSLGSYTILFSVMTGRLKKALKTVKNPRGINYLEEINATFFHFIFVQIVCLMWAFLFDGTFFYDLVKYALTDYKYTSQLFRIAMLTGSFVGHLLLIYSFLLILAAAIAVYRIASIVDPADG
ncbi:hypothetical protein [Agrobacterium sp. YIC 4121]|uniref:hypothetical protein n=1 Tax=Agrobacterium sp. YIC 4121 TaxID=1923829 RepID=UPI00098FB4A4|nr:hypothetical protein [Agrobacterium sp. YIC 4121]OOO34755.1 hypothetical protein BTE54_08260 [Agrobacterium sp. YIC 4121]